MGAIRGAAIGMTLAVGLTSTTAFSADQEAMVMEEFTIPAADPGIALYIRNKHLTDVTRVSSERTVLFVHGATYPAEAAFDLARRCHSRQEREPRLPRRFQRPLAQARRHVKSGAGVDGAANTSSVAVTHGSHGTQAGLPPTAGKGYRIRWAG